MSLTANRHFVPHSSSPTEWQINLQILLPFACNHITRSNIILKQNNYLINFLLLMFIDGNNKITHYLKLFGHVIIFRLQWQTSQKNDTAKIFFSDLPRWKNNFLKCMSSLFIWLRKKTTILFVYYMESPMMQQ